MAIKKGLALVVSSFVLTCVTYVLILLNSVSEEEGRAQLFNELRIQHRNTVFSFSRTPSKTVQIPNPQSMSDFESLDGVGNFSLEYEQASDIPESVNDAETLKDIKAGELNDFLKMLEEKPSNNDPSVMGISTYCQRLSERAPRKSNKFFFADNTNNVLTYLWKYKGWTLREPVPYIRAEHSSTGVVESVVSPLNPDYPKFAPEDVNMFVLTKYSEQGDRNAKPGVDFACPDTQLYNRVPGSWAFCNKNKLSSFFHKYQDKLIESGLDECFDMSELLPLTFDLNDAGECRRFFSTYKRRAEKTIENSWVMKITDKHHGVGIYLLDEGNVHVVEKKFDYGNGCGRTPTSALVQKLIRNILKIDGKKCDLRVYLFISSTSPLVAFYHEGFIRMSIAEYGSDSPNPEGIITNTSVARKTENQELIDNSTMTFKEFQTYLDDHAIVEDPRFVQSVIVPTMKRHLVHVVRMAQPVLEPGRGYYELYGVDFLIDSDFKVWFLESNRNPSLKGVQLQLKKRLLLEYANIIESRLEGFVSSVELPHKHFEPIIDETKEGLDRYFGLLSRDCMETIG